MELKFKTPISPLAIVDTAATGSSMFPATEDHTHSGLAYALLAGRSGGQTLKGDTASGGSLTIQSTAHATKGMILLGTSAYDEANNRLGIGNAVPAVTLDVTGTTRLGHAATTPVSIGAVPPTSVDSIFQLFIGDAFLSGQTGAGGELDFGQNCYFQGDFKYRRTAGAARISMGDNGTPPDINLWTAISGSADNVISWSRRFTIRNNGNVGINTSGATSKFAVAGNATIGSGLASSAAPADGLLVSTIIGVGGNVTSMPGSGSAGIVFGVDVALSSMATGTAGLYAKTTAGVTHLIAIASDGTTVQLV